MKTEWTQVERDAALLQIQGHYGEPIVDAKYYLEVAIDLCCQRNRALAALKKIVAMNRQTAKDQYGNADKAELWSCVTVAREAIGACEGAKN